MVIAYEFNDDAAVNPYADGAINPPVATHTSELPYIFDLPDVPSNLLGSADAAALLAKTATELRIANPKDNGAAAAPRWSFDAKFYAIR